MATNPLFDALAERRSFILYRLVPRDSGKTDKIPCDPITGRDISAQEPANWMPPHEAALWADAWTTQPQDWPAGTAGFGVGLVIGQPTGQGGLFAIDLDSCRAGDGWQPHVANFIGRFPGAYVETSVSGQGIHIIGSYVGAPPIHCTRNKDYRAELYTRLRFIAIGAIGAVGNPTTDATSQLAAFADQFFPPHGDIEHGFEWTDKPVPQWRGPDNDDELIARALRSSSAGSVFSGRAKFADLWHANADALGRSFPPQNAHSAWDGSAADQALANHLSFWSGNNCERMLALMRRSGLVRPKWERMDYMRSTILRACGDQREWYTEREPAKAPEAPANSPSPEQLAAAGSLTVTVPLPPATPAVVPPPPQVVPLKPGQRPPPGSTVGIHQQREMFDGLCYVRDVHKIQLPDGLSVSKDRFDVMFAGRQYLITVDGQRPSKSAWDAFTANEVYDFPQVTTQCFDPALPTGAIRTRDGITQINCYKPAEIRGVAGDPGMFLSFLRTLIPDERDNLILRSWMAAAICNIGVKFSWAPFVQGVKGNGKTTLARIMEYCISQRYTHWAKSSELGEKFNSVFTDKLLVIVDETRTQEQMELQEILKLYITSKRIEVRPMFAEKMMKDVCFNMFLLSNHKNGVRIDKDERRFAPFYCAQQSKADLKRDGLTTEFFIRFNKWLEADGFAVVFNYLQQLAIPDEFNPAAGCVTAPITTSTEQAVTESLGGVEQEILSAIEQKREGFRNGWISSVALDHLLAQLGKDKVVPRNMRQTLVIGLGYEPHPALPKDGLCELAMPDGTMPRLFLTKGHPWAVGYLTPAQVREGYLEAQRAA